MVKSSAVSTGRKHAFNLLTVNTVPFVLQAGFHDAEVAAWPVSHAEHSEFDMEAESDVWQQPKQQLCGAKVGFKWQ